MSDLSERKTLMRKAAFERRKLAHKQGMDAQAQAHLARALTPYQGQAITGYMPIRTEISPLPIMAAWQGPVGVPVILGAGKPLAFHRWTDGCAMVEGAFGAHIPANAVVIQPDVVILPLVAFDLNGGRLGYGGGFYDRTLELLRAARPTVAIGFAYAAQQAEDLPLETTDQPLDMIVTENGITRF